MQSMRFLWYILHITCTLVCCNGTREWAHSQWLGVNVSLQNPRLFLFLSLYLLKSHGSSCTSLTIFKNTCSKVLAEGLMPLKKAKRAPTLNAIPLTLSFISPEICLLKFLHFSNLSTIFDKGIQTNEHTPMSVCSLRTRQVEVRRHGVIPWWWKRNGLTIMVETIVWSWLSPDSDNAEILAPLFGTNSPIKYPVPYIWL